MLNTAFTALSAGTNLRKSRFASNAVVTHWAPLISIGDPEEPLRIGIGPDEHGSVVWMIEGKEEVYPLSAAYWRALVLLEMPFLRLMNALRDQIAFSPEDFPAAEIVRAGLQQGSEYWARCSLAWIPNIPAHQQKELIPIMHSIPSAKWASQGLRQEARRLARALSKQHE